MFFPWRERKKKSLRRINERSLEINGIRLRNLLASLRLHDASVRRICSHLFTRTSRQSPKSTCISLSTRTLRPSKTSVHVIPHAHFVLPQNQLLSPFLQLASVRKKSSHRCMHIASICVICLRLSMCTLRLTAKSARISLAHTASLLDICFLLNETIAEVFKS